MAAKFDAYMPNDPKQDQLNWLAEEIRRHEHLIENIEKSKQRHMAAIERLEQHIKEVKELK